MLPRSIDYFYDRQKMESLNTLNRLDEGWADSIGNAVGKGAEALWNSKDYRTKKFMQNELQRQKLASILGRSGSEGAKAELARQQAADQAKDLSKLERGRTLRTLSAVTKPVTAVGGAINTGLNKLAAWKLGQNQPRNTNPAPSGELTRAPIQTTVVSQPTQQSAQTTQTQSAPQSATQPAPQPIQPDPQSSPSVPQPAVSAQTAPARLNLGGAPNKKASNKPASTLVPGTALQPLQARNRELNRGGTGVTKRYLGDRFPPSPLKDNQVPPPGSWISDNEKELRKARFNAEVGNINKEGFSNDATSANFAANQKRLRARTEAFRALRKAGVTMDSPDHAAMTRSYLRNKRKRDRKPLGSSP